MTHSVPNAFMASEPGQPFWLFFLARIMKHAENTQWQARAGLGLPAGPAFPQLVVAHAARAVAGGHWAQMLPL